MTTSSYRWHSVSDTFAQICRHQAPWVALGHFLNDWWFFAVEYRRELIETPLPIATTLEMQRWAAFCAAMVEWLSWQDDVPCPAWTSQDCYILSEPWFVYEDEESRSWLLATTPAPFKVRNIYGGDRMFNRVPHRSAQQNPQFGHHAS